MGSERKKLTIIVSCLQLTRQNLYPFWGLDVGAIKSILQNLGRPKKLFIIDSWFMTVNSTLQELNSEGFLCTTSPLRNLHLDLENRSGVDFGLRKMAVDTLGSMSLLSQKGQYRKHTI